MVLLLLICCFLLLALLVLAIVMARAIIRAYNGFLSDFYSFTNPPAEGKPSPMAETFDLIAQQFAARISQSFTASLNGQASGMARGMKAIEGEIAQANLASSGNPLAQVAGMMFQKQIKKNPMLGMALSQIKLGGVNGTNLASQSNGSPRRKMGF